MSSLINIARCMDCAEKKGVSGEFGIKLEYEGKEGAIEILKHTKCPECGGENWYFTDTAEH